MANESAKLLADAANAAVDTIAVSITTVASTSATTTTIAVSTAAGIKVHRRKPQPSHKRQVLLFI